MGAMRRGSAGLAGILVGLGGVLHLSGGCNPRPAPVSTAAPSASPVEIRCERIAGGVPNVTLRNRTHRALDVSLLGFAYAGQRQWQHWWTQYGIRVPPAGSWSARIDEIRLEKIEVRDRRNRLLCASNLMTDLPPIEWGTITALHSRTDWQPFVRQEGLGQRAGRRSDPAGWRSIPPSELTQYLANLRPLWVRVIGDVRPESLSPEQVEALRGLVERGRTLIVCGGADQARLRGWEQAGLLAAPVRGIRTVPGLRGLARRYGRADLVSPIAVADVGAVSPPARILLAERGLPLVIERPLGAGRLLFVTFDPTRPPFRGSALERPFWQEWAIGGQESFTGIAAPVEEADAYVALQRRLHLLPPGVGLLAGVWLGYLLILLLVLVPAGRRSRGLVALSLAGSVAALALGPVLRSPRPVASSAGLLYLRSGDDRGWWRGSASVMTPGNHIVTLRVPKGRADCFWDSPSFWVPSSLQLIARPQMRRWVPKNVLLDAPVRLRGDVTFDLERAPEGIFASVCNRTPHRLRELTVFWKRSALVRLGDLPPGGKARRLLARVSRDGAPRGIVEGVPRAYGEIPGFGNRRSTSAMPLLLALCPPAPRPTLLMDERAVPGEGYTALLVAPSGFNWGSAAGRSPSGNQPRTDGRAGPGAASFLPAEVVAQRVVIAANLSATAGLRVDGDWLDLGPGEWAVIEFRLPEAPDRARPRRLELRFDSRASLTSTFRLQVLDVPRQDWFGAGTLNGSGSIVLPSGAGFIDPLTSSLLARVKNITAPGTLHATVRLDLRGDREER